MDFFTSHISKYVNSKRRKSDFTILEIVNSKRKKILALESTTNMPGCKPFSSIDLDRIRDAFDELAAGKDIHRVWPRNKAIFFLQCYTGFRISELVSIRLKQVIEGDDVSHSITVPRRQMKGGNKIKGASEARTVELNERSRELIRQYLADYGSSESDPDSYLFHPVGKPDKSISSRTCQLAYDKAFETAKIADYSRPYRLSTHSCRKTFARAAKGLVQGDLKSLQQMMGHKSLQSTAHYIESDSSLIEKAWRELDFE